MQRAACSSPSHADRPAGQCDRRSPAKRARECEGEWRHAGLRVWLPADKKRALTLRSRGHSLILPGATRRSVRSVEAEAENRKHSTLLYYTVSTDCGRKSERLYDCTAQLTWASASAAASRISSALCRHSEILAHIDNARCIWDAATAFVLRANCIAAPRSCIVPSRWPYFRLWGAALPL